MLGAFGAHVLRDVLGESERATYELAVRYQMYHALALLAVGVIERLWGVSRASRCSTWAFVVGVILFSGSLYLLSLSGLKWLGAITPFGGVALLIGWGGLLCVGWGCRGRSGAGDRARSGESG